MKRAIYILIAAMLTLAAGRAEAKGKGTTGAAFMKIDAGSEQAGKGGAVTADYCGALSSIYNPAALGLKESTEITASYNSWLLDMDQKVLGIKHSTGRGHFGFSLVQFSAGEIERRGKFGQITGSFFPSDLLVNGAYCLKAAENLTAGINLKYITQNIDDVTGRGAAADIGLIYADNGFAAGIKIENIGTGIIYPSKTEKLDAGVNLGLLYGRKLSGQAGIKLMADSGYGIEGFRGVKAGASLELYDFLNLNCGYNKVDLNYGFTFGAGIRLNGIKLDYAYIPFNYLGDSHRVTLTYIP